MANFLQCRVCKRKDSCVFSWNKRMYLFKNMTFGDCYEEVTQLSSKQKEVELPQSICLTCAKDLKTTYEFMKKARKSDREFRMALVEKNSKKKFEWVAVTKIESDDNETNNDILVDNEEHLENYDDELSEVEDEAELEVKTENEAAGAVAEFQVTAEIKNAKFPADATKQSNNNNNNNNNINKINNNNNNKNNNNVDENAISVVLNQLGYFDDDDNVVAVTEEFEFDELIEEQLDIDLEKMTPIAAKIFQVKHIEEIENFNDANNKICPICFNEFEDNELPDHIANEHNHKKVLCEQCPRYFRDNHHLRRHQVVHERNRKPKFSCNTCGRKFLTLGILQGHQKTHDKNRKRRYQCDECDKAFYHKPSLRLHKQQHAGIALECQFCEKRLWRQIDLEIHLRRHTGEFPFKCETCDKGFVTRSLLVRHLETHKGMRFSCDICGKEYSHKTSLRQHCKVHTGLPLKCGVCEKEFERNSKVRRHLSGVHKMEDNDDLDNLVIDVSTGEPYRRKKNI